MSQTTTKRYRTLRSYPGIRKDLQTSKYLVSVSINKKRIAKTFNSLPEALQWRNSQALSDYDELLDGELEKPMTFRDFWEKYKTEHLETLEKATRDNRLGLEKFFDGLWDYELKKINPNVITRHILAKKEIALKLRFHRRKNFDHELKFMKAMFNWYREELDYEFSNPVLRKHKALGVIAKEPPKNKKMNAQELKLFLDALKGRPFYYDFALTQLLTAGRVQEIAGLQKKNVDFSKGFILIKEVAVWDRKTKKFDHLKATPKNGEMREVHLSSELARVLQERIEKDQSHSTFVFHDGGEPLTYRQIQYNYAWALQKAGLFDRFSGTHILRHSMATLTRLVTGSLDSTQAVTGHKDAKLVQHYAHLDREENKRAITAVEDFLNRESFFGPCEQDASKTGFGNKKASENRGLL